MQTVKKRQPDYQKEILCQLVSSYRKSKKSRGESSVPRATSIKVEAVCPDYYNTDVPLLTIDAVNEAAEALKALGFIDYALSPGTYEIDRKKKLVLCDTKIEEIENYLLMHYGIRPSLSILADLQKLVSQYYEKAPVCRQVCESLQNIIDTKKPGYAEKDLEKHRKVLKALSFIENNASVIYLREASQMIYGTTKVLDPGNKEEGYVLEEVCRLLWKQDGKEPSDGEYLDEILKKYHILKEPEQISIKGMMTIYIAGAAVDISVFTDGITFLADTPYTKVIVNAKRLVTIENKTAYHRFSEPDTAVFYLGGFGNRFQEDFLRKVYESNPDLEYLHFGDIDVNGFWIHNNLVQNTGIPFRTYRMGIEELSDERYHNCLVPLTENDKKRILTLLDYQEYYDTIQYMLKHGIKLEQEIIVLSDSRILQKNV